MQLDREQYSGVIIRSFAAGRLRVNDEVLESPVILTPDTIIPDWTPPAIDALSVSDFDAALDCRPEVILFGTGETQAFPPIELITAIMQRGIGFEVMATAAACRTFNVLAGEGRRVAAALLI